MTKPHVVALDGDLAWVPFDIPGGSEPVRLVRLRAEPETGALTVLVRFPAGWERPGPGSYEAAEEAVFLDGTLEMSGETYRDGDWGWIAARAVRFGTRAGGEVLALARFSCPPRWVPSWECEAVFHRRLEPCGEPSPSPVGSGKAWLLRRGTPDSAWLADPPEPRAAAPCDTELIDLGGRSWAFVPAGSAFPRLEGPCFCRTFSGR